MFKQWSKLRENVNNAEKVVRHLESGLKNTRETEGQKARDKIEEREAGAKKDMELARAKMDKFHALVPPPKNEELPEGKKNSFKQMEIARKINRANQEYASAKRTAEHSMEIAKKSQEELAMFRETCERMVQDSIARYELFVRARQKYMADAKEALRAFEEKYGIPEEPLKKLEDQETDYSEESSDSESDEEKEEVDKPAKKAKKAGCN